MIEEKNLNMIIKTTTENVFDILKKNGFEIKESKSTFQKTEQLLYLMPNLKKAITYNKNKINDLKKFGIIHNKKAVHIIPETLPVKQDEDEIIQKEIFKLQQRNHIIDSQIRWVNKVLSSLASDKYYDLIKLKYFENKTHEEIAEIFMCDTKTIGRNKNRLINSLKVLLFPNDSINELGG